MYEFVNIIKFVLFPNWDESKLHVFEIWWVPNYEDLYSENFLSPGLIWTLMSCGLVMFSLYVMSTYVYLNESTIRFAELRFIYSVFNNSIQNINDTILLQSHVLHHHDLLRKYIFQTNPYMYLKIIFSCITAIFKPFRICETTLKNWSNYRCIIQPQNI